MSASTTQTELVSNLFAGFGQLLTDAVPILEMFLGIAVGLFFVWFIFRLIGGGIRKASR